MKSLIKDSSAEMFKTWAASVLSSAAPEPGFHKGEEREFIITHMTASDEFKLYLHSGYEMYLKDSIRIMLEYPTDVQPKVFECLHHERITVGFMMGLKYAMYLHEQRELATMSTMHVNSNEGVL